MPFLLMM